MYNNIGWKIISVIIYGIIVKVNKIILIKFYFCDKIDIINC